MKTTTHIAVTFEVEVRTKATAVGTPARTVWSATAYLGSLKLASVHEAEGWESEQEAIDAVVEELRNHGAL